MWIKGGSILPILLHDNALSVLRAIDKPIKLEVFPDQDLLAHGYLVLDDGWSTKPNKSILNFLYQSDTLQASIHSDFKSNKTISEVQIYGIDKAPVQVYNF